VVIEFDPAKNHINMQKHGVSLADAGLIDWSSARIVEDRRKDYSESRYQALGMLGGRLHFVAFTPRNGVMRVISLRKANMKEVRSYEQA
jgi:uncharacterized DUF497 family protein